MIVEDQIDNLTFLAKPLTLLRELIHSILRNSSRDRKAKRGIKRSEPLFRSRVLHICISRQLNRKSKVSYSVVVQPAHRFCFSMYLLDMNIIARGMSVISTK